MINCIICGRRIKRGIFFHTEFSETPLKFCCLPCFKIAPIIEDDE